MGRQRGAPDVPPRAALVDVSALGDAVATSLLKHLGFWMLPEATERALLGPESLPTAETDKFLALQPQAVLWPAAESDLWPMYRELTRLAVLTGVTRPRLF